MSEEQEQVKELDVDAECMRPLSPDAVKSRRGRGQDSFDYVPGEYVIGELCRIFGPTGWSSEVASLKMATPPEEKKGRNGMQWTVSYIAHVKLKCPATGATKEDYGFGSSQERDHMAIHESAVKEAITDGIKRCARQLGWRLGLALYDKERKHVRDDEEPERNNGRQERPRNAEQLTDHLRDRGARESVSRDEAQAIVTRIITRLGEASNVNDLQRLVTAERKPLSALGKGDRADMWGAMKKRAADFNVPEDALRRWLEGESNGRASAGGQ